MEAIATLAQHHRHTVRAGRRYRLDSRLKELERNFQLLYRQLSARIEAGEKGSRSEEWLLDNRHIVQEALELVRESLPPAYLRQLPAISLGTGQVGLRVRAVAEALVAGISQPLDLASVRQQLGEYQSEASLSTGELWALPALLRLALLEQLAEFAKLALANKSRQGAGENDDPHSVQIASVIISLRELRTHDWREFVESLSCIEQVLQADPAGAYTRMDFDSRDGYRKVVEELARGSDRTEQHVARQALALSEAGPSDSRTGHIGYYLVGDGRPQLESAVGYRPRLRDRLRQGALQRATTVYFFGLATFSAPVLVVLAGFLLGKDAGPALMLLVAVLSSVPLLGVSLAMVNGIITHMLPPHRLPKLDFREGIPDTCRTVVVMPVLFADIEDMQRILDCLEMNYLNNTDANLVYAVLGDFADADAQRVDGDDTLLHAARASLDTLNERYANSDGRAPFLLLHRERRWNPAEGRWMGWERKRGKLVEFNRLLQGEDGHSFTFCHGNRELLRNIAYVITLDADSQMPAGTAQRLVGAIAHPLNRAEVDADEQRVINGYGFLQPRLEVDPTSSVDTVFTGVFAGDRNVDIYTHAVSDAYQDLFGEAIFAGKGIYDPKVFSRTLAGRLPENAVLSHDLLEGAIGGAALLSDTVFYEQYPPSAFALLRRSHRWIRGDWQLLAWLGQRVPAAGKRKVANPLPAIHRWKIADNLRRSLEPPCLLALLLMAWSGWLPGSAWAWTLATILVAASPVWLEFLSLLWRSVGAPRRVPYHLRSALGQLRQRILHTGLSLVLLPAQALNSLDAIGRTLFRLFISHRKLLEWTSAAQVNRALSSSSHVNRAWRELWTTPLLAIGATTVVSITAPINLLVAAPFLLGWLCSPQLIAWTNRSRPIESHRLDEEDTRELHLLARRTWFFFEHFMGPDDHWLPPDNFQEEPLAVLARRTSPTNIGLGLLSILSAYDFGYLDLTMLLARLNNSFERMRGLERYRGHFLNWYETRELRPLDPRYVSTVDSGNLAASLLALAQGLEQLQAEPLGGGRLVLGIADTLGVIGQTLTPAESDSATAEMCEVSREIDLLCKDLQSRADEGHWLQAIEVIQEQELPALQKRMLRLIEDDERNFSAEALGRLRRWLDELHHQALAARRYQENLEPWQQFLQAPPEACRDPGTDAGKCFNSLAEGFHSAISLAAMPGICAVAEVALARLQDASHKLAQQQREEASAWIQGLRDALETARKNAAEYSSDLERLAHRARRWVDEMDFAFLFDRERHLFHIGYNVTGAALDPNYYDLLASESRLSGFIAMAKGDIPARHWRHLERPFRRLQGRVVLMSWSATLFEYLMPRLLMQTPENSLMGRACSNAIDAHRDFADRFSLPWGIAESGYYELDSHLHYQYRAFGVPGLGFRRDLGERLVVSPYSSVMALPFRAAAVVENLRKLREIGGEGQFGFYEAIDFGQTARPVPRRARIVRSYMSHHQGMILLALNNFLHQDIMVGRFHRDARIQALAPLLHERVPSAPPVLKGWRRPGVARRFHAEVALEYRRVDPASPSPRYNLLSNGHYTLVQAADGAGGSYWHDIAVTRWQPDPTRHQWGHWNYVRDLDSGEQFSLGLAPCGDGGGCDANFAPHSVELQRRRSQLFCRMHMALSSQHDIQARRLLVKNESDRERRLLLADYAEVVLAPEQDDRRHPAFAKLFVESQYLPDDQAMLYRRRPRGSAEKPVYLAHCVMVQPGVEHQLGWETDRTRFLGRWGSPARPQAVEAGLAGFSGTTGPVLDPVIGSAQEVVIPPHSEIEVVYLTGVSRSRRELLSAIRSYRSLPKVRWIFDLARMQSEHELRSLRIAAGDVHWMGDLLSAVLAPSAAVRASSRVLARGRHIQSMLWSRGISGDNPILLAQIRKETDIAFAEQVLQAHAYWSGRGIAVDLVLLDEESAGYAQQTRDHLQALITDVRGRLSRELAGAVIMVAGTELPGADRIRLLASARVLLDSGAGPVASQLERAAGAIATQLQPLPPFVPVRAADYSVQPTPELQRPADLLFDNGLGGFSADGREYVIQLERGQRPPAPWANVIANPYFGCLVSESGSCCTWNGNSGEHRLTAWNNDPVRDPSGELLYLRDEETAEVWSPTPAPRPADAAYQVRHGAGYTEYRHHSHGLQQSWRVFVDRKAPVKIGRLTLKNCWDRPRRLTATCYVEWVMGLTRSDSWPHLVSEFEPRSSALLARNTFVPATKPGVAFLTASLPPHGLTTDRYEFMGRSGGPDSPEALFRIGLSGRVQCGTDPCAAYQVHIDLAAGATSSVYFVMGEGKDRKQAITLAGEFRQPERAEASGIEVEKFWDDFLGGVQIQVPDRAMELLVNRWLPYQTLCSRLWARTGFYQSSGAFGFRDQLQDVLALVWTHPEWTRGHILRAASRQFQDGDVLHWWHERPMRGVRTRCSDDMLWLPYVTARYIRATGDFEILRESVPYLQAPPLRTDEHERYAEFETSEEAGSLYEHCCRAIERASAVGPHGLPVIGNGDWNDGFNRISTTGRGESVWLGWFLLRVCRDMAPLCEYIGDNALAEYYRQLGENFRSQVEENGWDGAWYRRAYYDDGTPVGSRQNSECKIDLIAQAWAVLSQDEATDRARKAMESVYEHLLSEEAREVLLLAPPFNRTKKDPGYIKGYPPGIRENGGQYTHGATWAVWAAAALGQGERAHQLFSYLNPITHSADPESMATYRTEPYVLAGDVYGVPPHVGRGGWTWYTGAAGWLYRGALEALLGLRILNGDSLEIHPCLPRAWNSYRVSLRFGRSSYDVEVQNCGGCPENLSELTLDGEGCAGKRVPLVDDGERHRVTAVFEPVSEAVRE
ncbi:GH36-type glycosyl hydrolase domain-containing protein [Microbulbifer yueqingensis]|uniref:Cyclic beta-1,2-glucan synthetase n=1 Tax=Microbulbifer yueqingensis TaxID=658219 RepID=A0A1G8ZTF7_9GAMM|nr:glucoamylase family protein [Microbulbifer yueqingensis]SDK18358.1 cyclic beta-1,2-glucan synthetase [Microbulbifer yueqingensis]